MPKETKPTEQPIVANASQLEVTPPELSKSADTPEDVQKLASAVFDNLFSPSKTMEKVKTKEEPPVPDEPAPDAPPAPKVPDAPPAPDAAEPKAKPPKKAKDAAPVVDPEEMRTIARDTVREVMDAAKPSPATLATPIELTDTQKRNLTVLQELEQTNPKYANISRKTLDGLAAFKAYQDKWVADHPGEDWNPDDEDHLKIEEKLVPSYDQEDFEDARISVKARAIVDQRERQRTEKDAATSLPQKIDQVIAAASADLVGSVDADLAKVLAEGGVEGVNKMREKDPLAVEVLTEARAAMVPWLAELEKLTDPDLNYRIVPGNPVHDGLNRYAQDCEAKIKAMPASDQLNHAGQRFATADEYSRMSAEQRGHSWTLDKDQIRGLVVNMFSNQAKVKITKLRDVAKAYAKSQGWSETPSASGSPPITPTDTSAPPASALAKPAPPSMASSTDLVKTAGGVSEVPKRLSDQISQSLFR
jgi:hypothetical protein